MSSQDSETPREHGLSVRLRSKTRHCRDDFQLSYPNFEGYCAIVLETTRPIVLFCRGLSEQGHLDVANALGTGLLELVDQAAQTVVTFPRVELPAVRQRDIVPSRYSYATLNLDLDSSAQVWKYMLEAGKTYVLRLGPAAFDENVLWCRYRDSDDAADSPVQKLPLRPQQNMTVKFTVYDEPPPPTFTAVFSVEPTVCRVPPSDGSDHFIDSNPLAYAFKFVVDITSNAPAPITVCIQQNVFGSTLPFGGLSCLGDFAHCVDAESGEEVDFAFGCMCFDSDPWPEWPDDKDFVEIPPAGGAAVRFVQRLGEEDQRYTLECGRRYRAQLGSEAKEGFWQWTYGTKEQVLRGTVEERKARWDEANPRDHRPIRVQQANEPVEFDVLD
ncbi:hypothetical protein DBV05_g10137 [Lasiodiplodia theobromae]|uniref:Uncharacterized protein n=1 Tax=Lasiodiplodia theobromae TaxID=45133 RepID=A0A5N5D0V7_9PEZI|nr:hypothetical protein DBV05_g10137 [Lasiodiplodia theobromae]